MAKNGHMGEVRVWELIVDEEEDTFGLGHSHGGACFRMWR